MAQENDTKPTVPGTLSAPKPEVQERMAEQQAERAAKRAAKEA